MSDDSTKARAARLQTEPHTERDGLEQRNQPDAGWERRNERHDRLREGQDHPLHHGQPLHGNHAHDGRDGRDGRD